MNTLFEKNMMVEEDMYQPGLLDVDTAKPDDVDLTYLQQDEITNFAYYGWDEKIMIKFNRSNQRQLLEVYWDGRIIFYPDSNKNDKFSNHYHKAGEVFFHGHNIILPEWLKYKIKKMFDEEDAENPDNMSWRKLKV